MVALVVVNEPSFFGNHHNEGYPRNRNAAACVVGDTVLVGATVLLEKLERSSLSFVVKVLTQS